MKNNILIIILLIGGNIFSQEERKLFQSEFAPYTFQCEKIGRLLIDKTIESNLMDWYEGKDLRRIKSEIEKLESDVDKSDLEVTYYLVMMNEQPLIYTFHFYNEETKTEFGRLFIRFNNRDNNLVDDIKVIDKKQLESINKESQNQPLPTNIPAPPLPKP